MTINIYKQQWQLMTIHTNNTNTQLHAIYAKKIKKFSLRFMVFHCSKLCSFGSIINKDSPVSTWCNKKSTIATIVSTVNVLTELPENTQMPRVGGEQLDLKSRSHYVIVYTYQLLNSRLFITHWLLSVRM